MRALVVARREFLERVRSRAFLVSTVLGPVLLTGFMIGPALLAGKQRAKTLRVAVLDFGARLRAEVEASLQRRVEDGRPLFEVVAPPRQPPESAQAELTQRVVRGELDGFVLLRADSVERSAVDYYGSNVGSRTGLRPLHQAVEEAVVARRLSSAGLDPERVKALTHPLELKTIRLTEQGAREDRGNMLLLSMMLLMMLYTSLAMWGAAIMNGVIEEKTNRVLEIVVSSLSPSSLFAGKLLGVGAAGLTQFLIWSLTLALIGVYGAAVAGSGMASMPDVSLLVVGAFVVFFVLGYFLYGSLYAALGASVNTHQEAQGLVFLVMMPLILGFVLFPAVLKNPDTGLAVWLSLVPFFAPLLMFLRLTIGSPPVWQLALAVALLVATIAGITWAAARVYRVGILMYGKKPTFPEILRWIRVG